MVAKFQSVFLDSGAISHMMNQLEWLEEYEESNRLVKVGNGIELKVKGKGTLVLDILKEDEEII